MTVLWLGNVDVCLGIAPSTDAEYIPNSYPKGSSSY